MDCQRITDDELVESYLNGRLDPVVQDELEVHILECPKCLARAEALNAIRTNLVPEDRRIVLPVHASRRWQVAWVGVAAAALVTMCVVGFYLFRSKGPKPAETTSTKPLPLQPAPLATGAETNVPAAAGSSKPKQPAVARNSTNLPSPHPSPAAAVAGAAQRPNLVPEQTSSQQTVVAQRNGPQAGASTFDFTTRKSSLMEMSQGANVELYALAAVQPPPYPSSDTAEAGYLSNSADSSGLASSLLPGGRTLFQDAMVAYREKRYADAAKLLESVVGATPEAVVPNFYLGICRLIEDRPSDAVVPLKNVISAPAGPVTQSAHFYLAKAYLRVGDMAKAESEMQIAAKLPGRLASQARSLAERIHALRSADTNQEKGANPPTLPQN
jgi:hypothetical protein